MRAFRFPSDAHVDSSSIPITRCAAESLVAFVRRTQTAVGVCWRAVPRHLDGLQTDTPRRRPVTHGRSIHPENLAIPGIKPAFPGEFRLFPVSVLWYCP